MSTTYRALEARPSTFDELLEACGGCGRYQIRLLLIIGALCGTSGALGLSFYFIGRAVPLRCPRSGDAGDFDDDDSSCAAVHTGWSTQTRSDVAVFFFEIHWELLQWVRALHLRSAEVLGLAALYWWSVHFVTTLQRLL